MPEAPPPNTISPNDFVSIFAEMLKAETDKDARVGKLRSIRARLEKAGCDRACDMAGWAVVAIAVVTGG